MNKQFLFTFVVITIQVSFAQTTPEFSSRIDMGLVEHPELTEASGLVESRKNAHVLWSHNDRNNQNRLFAFNSAGTHLGIYWIDGVENRDWEDLAIGPGPIPNVDYLYIGDIGDNDAVHENKYIYRIPEPVVDFNQVPVEITIFDVDTIIFQYPDGNRDAETLLLDPLTKDLYVVSKREFEDIRVYRAPYPQPTNQVFTLEHVATIQLSQIVGGDISPSGLEILLKTYTSMYYWNRSSNQNLWESFDNPPIILPYVEEMQGEAVSWAADSMGYYTLSEEPNNIPAHLFYYPRINPSIVVINEIMQNPLAVGDEFGEWFELFNNSTDPVNLMGWIIKDTDTDFHMISQSIVLSPGEFLVLSNNSDSTTNGGLKVDYQYNNIVLDNSVDEILMVSPTGVVVDSVAYDNGVTFPNTKGTSMALLNENMDNSFGLNWRESTLTFGDGDLGTPGLSNSGTIPFLSIKDIQFTTDSSGLSPLFGQRVTISGTLSIDPFGFSGSTFFIQDSVAMWSGIMVKYTSAAQIGDNVKLTGTVAEANNALTILIDVSDFEILENQLIEIVPIPVSTGEISTEGINAEAYESVLVTVTGICDNENLGFREWSIDDGTGSTRVYHTLIGGFTPILGNEYSVTGIQFYRDNNFKVLPRDINDISDPSALSDNSDDIPKIFELHQNYPNPFNPTTIISYSIPVSTHVSVVIFDILGRKIHTLINEQKSPGNYSLSFNGSNLSSGVYFYKLQTKNFTNVKKLLIIK